ncbi:TonB-dependent siderophore receptor [Shewanella corallii]|uniref:TonB-dependent siderophore receptor n=1 Tax=Shewanella corallii TaxID=560080 RepID=A0ABT0NCI4_9GAMM|nr:TonB-dependent siderophore receptor [Shewanella corallii]MCL2916198.1 TonB-dependent siderophore receptor [Shewanella corallii]
MMLAKLFNHNKIWVALLSTGVSLGVTAKEQTEEPEMEIIEVSPRGIISYVSASAAKNSVPVVETPVSVSVLTEKRIEDLGAETIQDALGFVAGVYNGPFGVDTRGDWAQIRGVAPLTYQDGLQTLFGNYNNTRANPYMLEQIEILKGPSSVLYGQGSTGGIINLVTKRPKAETAGELWAQVGNYDRVQLAGDVTGAIDEDATLLYRLTGLYRDSETQTDFVKDDSYFISPALSWYITDDTRLTLLTNFQKNETGSSTQFFPHAGTRLPAPNGQIPSERFVSEPGYDRYDVKQSSITVLLEQQLTDDLELNWSSRYSDSDAEYRSMFGYPFALVEDRYINRAIFMSNNSAESFTSDLQLRWAFDTGSLSHNLSSGLDYQQATLDTDRLFLVGAGGLLDIYNPEYGKVPTAFPSDDDIPDSPSNKQSQLGFYMQDSITWNRWILSLAMRQDWVKSEPGSPTQQSLSDDATTGRAGLMYAFDNGLSPYISYAQSFAPQLDTANGVALDPLKGDQIELGIKYQPAGTSHLITAAVYDITEKNKPYTDPLGNTSLTGEVEIRGFELEAQLEWKQIDVYASYAYTDTEKVKDTFGAQGGRLEAMPDNMLSVWATWRPADLLPGFKVGAGYRFVGETSDGSAEMVLNGVQVNTPLTTESYDLYDFMIGYEIGAFDLSLNVDNLEDETVITSCLFRGDCFYGQRRTITGNVKYRF